MNDEYRKVLRMIDLPIIYYNDEKDYLDFTNYKIYEIYDNRPELLRDYNISILECLIYLSLNISSSTRYLLHIIFFEL